MTSKNSTIRAVKRSLRGNFPEFIAETRLGTVNGYFVQKKLQHQSILIRPSDEWLVLQCIASASLTTTSRFGSGQARTVV